MAIQEIRVIPGETDVRGEKVYAEARRALGLATLTAVRTTTLYRLEGITAEDADYLGQTVFTDPLTEICGLNLPSPPSPIPRAVEVAYRPGVMNPDADAIIKAARDSGINPQAVDVYREYTFFGEGDLQDEDVQAIVRRFLVNNTVEHVVTHKPGTLLFEAATPPVNVVPIREASEAKLMELSKDKLFLDATEMKVIQDYFRILGRDPTDCELEIIAARWSEHCGHKTFNAKIIVDGVEKKPFFARIKEAARANFKGLVVSAFGDNSGVIKFFDGWALCGKGETHNSPSALEPYGGAMTGSGGVFRDIGGTGQGARTLVATNAFCLAPPDLNNDLLPPGTLAPDYIHRRVVDGVRDYGNHMGIPTGNGSFHYHPDFRAKPTVLVGAYGTLPEARAHKGEPQIGDLVVIIGGPTGRDGIHGATFSSGVMTDRTAEVNSSAVQIGNAIEQKRTFDALLEARDLDLLRALTDCGAAGFSSAIGEMGENIGVTVDISKAPLKYSGLAPWEIWLSESQERMVAAISPANVEEFLEVCAKYNVTATVLGEFDGSHTLTVNHGDQTVAELDYGFLQNGLPQRTMHARWERQQTPEKKPESPTNEQQWTDRFKAVLAHGNVCSKEPIVRQYDHGVQGSNITAPYGGATQEGPNDALVVRPLLDKPYGMVVSHGMNPILNRIDPYKGTVWAITEAAANFVSAGGDIGQAAAVGNYIWPFPDEESLGALDRSVDAAVDMMHALQLPVISGKDSLSSTYRGQDGEVIKIPPVYAMSIFGRIPDVEKTMTTEIKKPGQSTLYLVGQPSTGMAGSTYYDVAGGSSNELPVVNIELLPKTLAAVQSLIQSGEITACHDISEGGLATAVAEMCFGSLAGAELHVPHTTDEESFLFNETAGCFVVEVPDGQELSSVFTDSKVPVMPIGRTTQQKDIVAISSSPAASVPIFKVGLDELKKVWQAPMKELFHVA